MSTSRSHELDFMNENLNGEKAHLEAPLIMDKDSRRQESEEDVSAGDGSPCMFNSESYLFKNSKV